MKKALVAGAASAVLAVMPAVGVFAEASTDVRQSTDTLNVTVNDTCKITSTYGNADNSATFGAWGTRTTDTTGNTSTDYTTEANTWTVSMDNSASKTSPVHTMAIFCNNTKGWDLKAQNAEVLTTTRGGGATEDTIAYDTGATAGTTEGYYVNVAATTGSDAGAAVSNSNVSAGGIMSDLHSAAASIYSKAPTTGEGAHTGATSTASLDVSYTVATVSTTEAGTYTGTVVYTLVPKS